MALVSWNQKGHLTYARKLTGYLDTFHVLPFLYNHGQVVLLTEANNDSVDQFDGPMVLKK